MEIQKKISQKEENNFFMQKALREAKIAFEKDEVPVGAILVCEGKVIARGYNQVELLKDATAHAEMLCLSAAFDVVGDWRLLNTTLYTTLEPCLMCAGAILQSRIKKLVWGAPDHRLGANGSFIDVFKKKHPMHTIEITSHVLEEECGILMKQFFQKKRG